MGLRSRATVTVSLFVLASCGPVAPTTAPTPDRGQEAAARPATRRGGAISSVWGFTAPWDPRSDSSVRSSSTKLDAVVTGWIQLDSVTSVPSLLYADDSAKFPPSVQRLTLVTSWHGQRFHPETIRRLADDQGALALAASRVGALVADGRYRGIVLDLEEQSAADLPLTVRVASAIADSAKAHGATFTAIALPAGDTAAYPTRSFVPIVDFIVVMLYDEHWATSAPGPVATPEWVRRTLSLRASDPREFGSRERRPTAGCR